MTHRSGLSCPVQWSCQANFNNTRNSLAVAVQRPPKGSRAPSLQGVFNGLRAPRDKIAVLQGSIACFSGLQGLYFLKFGMISMGIVWAPGLQAFKMMGSRALATLLRGPHKKLVYKKLVLRWPKF